MSKKLTHKEFVSRLKEVQPQLVVKGKFKYIKDKILVSDKYGDLLVGGYSLLCKHVPTPALAVNKTEYFKNRVMDLYDVEIIGNYIKSNIPIIIKDSYGYLEVLPNMILLGYKPTIRSAINKTEYFANKGKEVHNGKYDYSLVDYKGVKSKLKIICPKHGVFEQRPDQHLNGKGCMMCAHETRFSYNRSDFIKNSNNRSCILYKIKCFSDTEVFYKIGITSNSIKRRFSCVESMPYMYKVIKEIKGDAGFIFDLEKIEHRKHKNYKYTPAIKFNGCTECFTKLI